MVSLECRDHVQASQGVLLKALGLLVFAYKMPIAQDTWSPSSSRQGSREECPTTAEPSSDALEAEAWVMEPVKPGLTPRVAHVSELWL